MPAVNVDRQQLMAHLVANVILLLGLIEPLIQFYIERIHLQIIQLHRVENAVHLIMVVKHVVFNRHQQVEHLMHRHPQTIQLVHAENVDHQKLMAELVADVILPLRLIEPTMQSSIDPAKWLIEHIVKSHNELIRSMPVITTQMNRSLLKSKYYNYF